MNHFDPLSIVTTPNIQNEEFLHSIPKTLCYNSVFLDIKKTIQELQTLSSSTNSIQSLKHSTLLRKVRQPF